MCIRDSIEAYEKNDMVFAVGPAGTGKTYLSIALAVKALKEMCIRDRYQGTDWSCQPHEGSNANDYQLP